MDRELFADLVLIVSVLASAACIARGLLMSQPQCFTSALLLALGGSVAYLVLQRGDSDADKR